MGIRIPAIPGESLREKKVYLATATKEQIAKVAEEAKTDTLYAKVKAGQVLVIPSGFMYMRCSLDDNLYARWAVGGAEDDHERVAQVLEGMMIDFPEYAEAKMGYSQYMAVLRAD